MKKSRTNTPLSQLTLEQIRAQLVGKSTSDIQKLLDTYESELKEWKAEHKKKLNTIKRALNSAVQKENSLLREELGSLIEKQFEEIHGRKMTHDDIAKFINTSTVKDENRAIYINKEQAPAPDQQKPKETQVTKESKPEK